MKAVLLFKARWSLWGPALLLTLQGMRLHFSNLERGRGDAHMRTCEVGVSMFSPNKELSLQIIGNLGVWINNCGADADYTDNHPNPPLLPHPSPL